MAVIAWLSDRCFSTADVTGILVPCCHATLFISVPHAARMADPYWIYWYVLFHIGFRLQGSDYFVAHLVEQVLVLSYILKTKVKP